MREVQPGGYLVWKHKVRKDYEPLSSFFFLSLVGNRQVLLLLFAENEDWDCTAMMDQIPSEFGSDRVHEGGWRAACRRENECIWVSTAQVERMYKDGEPEGGEV